MTQVQRTDERDQQASSEPDDTKQPQIFLETVKDLDPESAADEVRGGADPPSAGAACREVD